MKKLFFLISILFFSFQDKNNSTVASWYGSKYHGKTTANGEVYDQMGLTCASNTLAFGTVIKVTNLANKKSVLVRVNDRGPFKMDGKGHVLRPLHAHPSRGLDLSKGAFSALADLDEGIIRVVFENIYPKGQKPLDADKKP